AITSLSTLALHDALPISAAKLPKVSKNRSVSSEGLIRYKPDIVLAIEGEVSRAVIQQLRTAGVKFVAIRQQYSSKGALNFIQDEIGRAHVELQSRENLVC